ncbi:hypothetical protein LOC68_06080 [Blastopirellula sp. JC732]|uniref:Uncharacterized protein n=1 Tax=Blastopirellula sediminis TaxID=2894196 RepID=A0A9X1SFV6_9BACT|nr:hypothetical protein [Blastopirellula sediminis]MCC9609267.1 hypothetical protein [Blastopirellula sediminis]MCC9627956.1 hypothetical protein [Blastopirellula sediminis]
MPHPASFDLICREFDAAVNAIQQQLETLGITVTDFSNRQPHYDPLRSIRYSFATKRTVTGEQQKVTATISVVEPADPANQLSIAVSVKAERFWTGKPSHWESFNETSLMPAEFLESDLAALISKSISDGQAEISRSV